MDWNAPVQLGKAAECCAIRCAICGETVVYRAPETHPADESLTGGDSLPGVNLPSGAESASSGGTNGTPVERARQAGWKQTNRLGAAGERLWVCPAHHEPDCPDLYVNKEDDRRDPRDVFGDLTLERESRAEGKPQDDW
jgi:hypothetical protein